METIFDQAEIYVKNLFSIPIELAIKRMNSQLKYDRVIPGVKLFVTGGHAIHTYFPNSPELTTHDYDLKLIAPKNTNYTTNIRDRMLLLGNGIIKYLEIDLNNYSIDILNKLKQDIKQLFNLTFVLNEKNNIFTSSSQLKNKFLNVLTFKLKGTDTNGNIKTRKNSITDVYVVDPEEIYHYKTFTGLSGSDPILSKNSGNYYIPYKEINGIPYAGMGYIIWDAIRMVEYSKKGGLKKYPRYVAKYKAIIQALNTPNENLSCNSMKEYMLKCEKSYKICKIKSKQYRTVNQLLRFAIREGILPPDNTLITTIKNTYDIDYLCRAIKKIV